MPSRISLILDVGQLLLDIGGIVDPTPASDTVSGLISVFRGRWVDAGVSAVSFYRLLAIWPSLESLNGT
jgi:hypothetical protein